MFTKELTLKIALWHEPSNMTVPRLMSLTAFTMLFTGDIFVYISK